MEQPDDLLENLDPRKLKALEGMRRGGTLTAAAREAGVVRLTIVRWRDDDEYFAGLLEDAHDEHCDLAEEELHRRAVLGDTVVSYHKGEPVQKLDPSTGIPEVDDDLNPVYHTVNKKSDTLLPVYLKSKRAQYREKTDLTLLGPGGGPLKTENEVTVTFVDSPAVSVDELAAKYALKSDGEKDVTEAPDVLDDDD